MGVSSLNACIILRYIEGTWCGFYSNTDINDLSAQFSKPLFLNYLVLAFNLLKQTTRMHKHHTHIRFVPYLALNSLPVLLVADDGQLQLCHLLHFAIHVDLLQETSALALQQT